MGFAYKQYVNIVVLEELHFVLVLGNAIGLP
jgi:hypothetical protein